MRLVTALILLSTPLFAKYRGEVFEMFKDAAISSTGGMDIVYSASAYQNPALYSNIKEFGASHFSYYSGFIKVEEMEFGSFNLFKTYESNFFLGYLHSSPIEFTTLKDSSKGVVDGNIIKKSSSVYRFFIAGATAGKNMSQKLSAGISVGLFYEDLSVSTEKGGFLDFGLNYREEKAKFACVLKNAPCIFSKNGGYEWTYPSIILGAGTAIGKSQFTFSLETEFEGWKDYAFITAGPLTISPSCGFQYKLTNGLFLMGGYGKTGITLGAALDIKKFSVNYALVPSSEPGYVQKVTLKFKP